MEQIAIDKLIDNKTIEELKVSDKSDGYFLVKSYEIKTSNNKKKYVDITFADKTGEINGKLWEYTEKISQIFEENSIVKVRGEVLEWQGKKQFKISKIRGINEDDDVDINDFIPTAPISSDKMYAEINNYIEKIEDEGIKALVIKIIKKYENKLKYYPAAKKNHHSYKGGLLYHILRMLQTGEKIGQVYDYLKMDYVYAGVMLHDICKTSEMDSNELGIVSDYTTEGKLLGHIIQGIKEIEIEADAVGLDKEKSLVLQHMILSHHYHPEFGSPKKPMTPEAELLHYLDIIDARMFDFENALKDVKPGEFSDRIWILDNRNLYKIKDKS